MDPSSKKSNTPRLVLARMLDHYERQRGMSDAEIHLFEGMVDDWAPPSNQAQVRILGEICEEERMKKKRNPVEDCS